MITIWKYALRIEDEQILMLPLGAKILSVGTQGGGLFLWAQLDPANPPKERIIRIFGTGNPIRETRTLSFLGTAHLPPFVWHVFEAWV